MISVFHLVASSHGGGATHVRDLALGLPHDHYRITVGMPLDGGNVSATDFTAAGVEFIPLDIAKGFAWQEVWSLRRLLQTHNFHLIHLHGARAAMYGRLAVIGLQPRPRVIFSIHGFAAPFYSFPKRTIYLGLEHALQQVTDYTICVAQAEANLFLSKGLAPASKTGVIAYGIDVARFASPPTDTLRLRETLDVGDGPLILTLCRLNVPRDFVSLLTAFKQIITELPTTRLLIVGDGPQRTDVQRLIRQLDLTDQVRITGFRDDVPALMALARVYVLTSYGWEGYPISTLEAQAAGVPVVVTDAGGSREAVQHEQTGLVIPKCRSDLLAKALLRLLRDPDLCHQMGLAGQQRARTALARERMIEAISSIYHRILTVKNG
ncbi:MAG: glycosyl transferase group 1 [Chloroflexota bacterium]|nr:MAG: glycosyl transferase group 1 [Chloroflexota bacterium]